MQLHTSFAFAILAAPLICAQSLSDFPLCAQNCNKIAQRVTPCDFNDINCVCKDPGYLATVGQCELDTCSKADQDKELSLAQQKCAPVGIAYGTSNATVVQPQDILDGDDIFPQCAQDCITSASAGTGVEIQDYPSLCFNNRGVLDRIQTCQKANCSQADYNKANSFGAQLCSFVPGSSGYGDPSVNRTNYTAASVFDTVLCSQIPATQALLNSTCKPDDYSCICNSASFSNVEAIGQGERNDCNPFDYLLLIVQTFQACKNVGVIIPLSNQTRATSIVANGTVNGSVGTTTGAPPPSQFTGTATALSLSWEVASVIAAVGIAALLL